MTYNIPELTLIGAATNLVLQESGQPKADGPADDCTVVAVDELASDLRYDFRDNW